jgi:hypothetical protein
MAGLSARTGRTGFTGSLVLLGLDLVTRLHTEVLRRAQA